MYHPFSYPQIFYTVVFLAPIISFIFAFSKASLSFKDFIYLYPSIFNIITISRRIFRFGIYFFSISFIIAANDFYKFSNNILQKNPLKKSSFYSFLLKLQASSAYLAVTGSLGFVTYPENNTVFFHFVMEIFFFINILVFLVLYDVIVKWIKEESFLNIYLYDALMVFVVSSFIIIRVSIIRNEDEPFLILSVNEYLSFFTCLLKFPICGWEMQKIRKNVYKIE